MFIMDTNINYSFIVQGKFTMDFIKIPSGRYDDVIVHLRKTFFCDEPLNKAVNLCHRNQGHNELENHSRLTLEDGLSVMAIDADNKIAGVALNGILRPGDLEQSKENLILSADPNFVKIFKFLYDQSLELDLFNFFNVGKLFELRILSVDPAYRGQGIAKKILAKSEQLARDNQFTLLKMDATSIYSQKIAESVGYATIKELAYDDYVDERGRTVFVVPMPHKSFKVMYKTIE